MAWPKGQVLRDREVREERVVLEDGVYRPSVGRAVAHHLSTDENLAPRRQLERRPSRARPLVHDLALVNQRIAPECRAAPGGEAARNSLRDDF